MPVLAFAYATSLTKTGFTPEGLLVSDHPVHPEGIVQATGNRSRRHTPRGFCHARYR